MLPVTQHDTNIQYGHIPTLSGGQIRWCYLRDMKTFYFAQHEFLEPTARKLQRNALSLWKQFELDNDVTLLRNNLFHLYGFTKIPCWKDNDGTLWSIYSYSMAFLKMYHPELEQDIDARYRKNFLGLVADGEVQDMPTPSVRHGTTVLKDDHDSDDIIAATAMTALLQVHERHRKAQLAWNQTMEERLDQSREQEQKFQQDMTRHVANGDRHVEQLTARVDAVEQWKNRWERSVRGFCEIHCHAKPTPRETYEWGVEMSRRYRHHMPNGLFEKVTPREGGQEVNCYEWWMLYDFFGALGLWKPPA